MLKKIILFLFILVIISCENNEKFKSTSLFLMGTYVDITLPEKNIDEFKNVTNLIDELSVNITKEIEIFNNAKGKIEISQHFYNLLETALNYNKISNGSFNIAIYSLLNLYGFPEGNFKELDEKTIHLILENVKKGIKIYKEDIKFYGENNGNIIDLNAFAKGYIVDEAVKYLRSKNINNFIINAGGDLYASGKKNNNLWRLGIKNPNKNGGFSKVVELSNKALATSGTYERFFINKKGEKISHLIDANTGKQPLNYVSISVIADKTEVADILATVYFFMTIEEIKKRAKLDNVEVFIITKDNKEIEIN